MSVPLVNVAQANESSVIDRRFIACDWDKSMQTVWNWQKSGLLPPPDFHFQGAAYWKRATYEAWKARALSGELASISKINNLKLRQPEPSAA